MWITEKELFILMWNLFRKKLFEDRVALIDPKTEPRKWLEKNYKSYMGKKIKVFSSVIYRDTNDQEIDMSKFCPMIVQGNKLSLCNIHDGNVILCSTVEYLDSIGFRRNNHEIAVFSDGNICQIAFVGKYDTPFADVWNGCLKCKPYCLINKNRKQLKKEIELLKADANFDGEYIIAFKYVYSKSDDNYWKEWYFYFKKEIAAIVKYAYSI